jgi:hypothetical protein
MARIQATSPGRYAILLRGHYMNAHRQSWLYWVFAIAVSAWTDAGCSAVAAASFNTVYPTGTFPLDVQNVQTALDRGGTVLLKATNKAGHATAFNFGAPDPAIGSGVDLHVDVTILGERVGQHMTTINGGYIPILGQVPVRTHIEGVDFETPLASAITLLASTGTDIIGNRINGVIGVEVVFGTDGDGIDLFGNDDPLNAITGHVRIVGNTIENLGADFANGMQLDEVAAEVEITGNTVNFPQSNGPVQTVGITAFRSHNLVSIVGNNVTMGPGSLDAFPAPIFVGGDLDARYLVLANNVASNHPNADGIIVTGGDFSEPTQGAVIAGNHIVIHSAPTEFGGAGVSAYGAVNNSLISANVIEGTSSFALQVAEGFLSTSTAESNHLVGNLISQHSSSTADVYFGTNTSNTSFVGPCKTHLDLGVSNHISCGKAVAPPAAATQSLAQSTGPPDAPRISVRGALLAAIKDRLAR